MEVGLQNLHLQSFILFSWRLWTVGLQELFFSLSGDLAVTLSTTFPAHSRIRLQSILDPSLLSVDTFDYVPSSEPFVVDIGDTLLRLLLPLRHLSLFHHIRWELVSLAAVAILFEHPPCCDLTESLWCGVSD
jgi:hypothetical protein